MAIVPMRLMLDHAAENGYAIPAYNVNNMEQIQAIMQAANETDSPVILQASRGARRSRCPEASPPAPPVRDRGQAARNGGSRAAPGRSGHDCENRIPARQIWLAD